MRIVGNYGVSLLDYLDGTKDMQSLFTQGSTLSYGAQKTLAENGINLSNLSAAATSSADNKAYETIRNTTENIRDGLVSIAALLKEEDTEDTSEAVKAIAELAEQYNTLRKNMKDMGGSVNNAYISELDRLITENKEKLEAMGITVGEDGSLVVETDTLSQVSAEDMKKLFGKDADFAEQLAMKTIYVEANAVQAIALNNYRSSVSGYSSTGKATDYADTALNNFIQSI